MFRTAVVALGGNAILKKGERGTIPEQINNVKRSLDGILFLVREGYNLAITHGNGPQAGDEVIRTERAKDEVPELPLDIIDAATEGWMGYLIQQSLMNRLFREKINRRVITLPTQVIVDSKDSSFQNPTKPIGPFYTKEEADKLNKKGIILRDDAGRGFRRVVPSPLPVEIVEKETIRQLVGDGVIVIAVGGGGIPVLRNDDGTLHGIEGVIDKDRAPDQCRAGLSPFRKAQPKRHFRNYFKRSSEVFEGRALSFGEHGTKSRSSR
jgi:carbamate kinase